LKSFSLKANKMINFPLESIYSKEKIMIRLLIFLFFATALFLYVIEPVSRNNKLINEKIKTDEDKLAKYQQFLQREDKIKTLYQSSFLQRMRETAEETDIDAFKELEAMAKKYSIKIIDIRHRQVSSQEIKEVLIELIMEGVEPAYIRFLYDLKKSSFLFSIKNFTLTSGGKTSLLRGEFSISYIPGLQ